MVDKSASSSTPSRDVLLGTSIVDQSARRIVEAPLWQLRRVMMFNRTTIVIIVSEGKDRCDTNGARRWPLRERRNERRRIRLFDSAVWSLPASRFIILHVRHLSHSIAAKRNAVRVSKWLCARRKQSFAIRACPHLRRRCIREGEISERKNAWGWLLWNIEKSYRDR